MPTSTRSAINLHAAPFVVESHREYHGKKDRYMSSHQLADFRKSAALHWWKYSSGLAAQIPEERNPAFEIGQALHCLVLEGPKAYERDFLVSPGPQNPKTGKPYGVGTKTHTEWLAEQTQTVIHPSDHVKIAGMAAAVRTHRIAERWLAHGQPELVVRANLYDVPCQIKCDWLNDELVLLVDVKSCGDLDYFEHDVRTYGYIHQLAFYLDVLHEATGETWKAALIGVEKQAPYRCGCWMVNATPLLEARVENTAAIQRYRLCKQKNHWPTGYEGMRLIA